MSDIYTRRTAALSPTVLPEHLRGIRETVLNPRNVSLYGPGYSGDEPNDAELAEIAFALLKARKGGAEAIDKIADYIQRQHERQTRLYKAHQNLIDGIVSWTGWAANWTRRVKDDETKAPPQEVVK